MDFADRGQQSVNFAFSEEQEELRRTVRQFLEAKSPETEVRRLMETTEGYDPAVWKQMGQELGLQGARDPRGVRRPGLHVHRARHRARGDGPRAAVRAVLLVGRARGERDPRTSAPTTQKKALLPGIASGDTIATLAFTEPSGKWDAAGITMEATEGEGGEFTLSGEKMFVIDGLIADLDRRRRAHRGHDRHRRHLVLHGRAVTPTA